jgi:hypothetical protein
MSAAVMTCLCVCVRACVRGCMQRVPLNLTPSSTPCLTLCHHHTSTHPKHPWLGSRITRVTSQVWERS